MEKDAGLIMSLFERLWRSVKYECVYLQEWTSIAALRDALIKYFYLYNYERPHQALGKLTPNMVHYGETIH